MSSKHSKTNRLPKSIEYSANVVLNIRVQNVRNEVSKYRAAE